jgi:uncharacterized membrane protein
MFGTMMVLNVWVHILPNQKAIIAASEKGIEPNYELGIKAKRRSMHNSYMTLPVLFIMISNHFPMTFGHKQSWLVLILIIAFGALTRHFMITLKKWPLILALLFLGIVIGYTKKPEDPEIKKLKEPVSYSEVRAIMQVRCYQCHSEKPTDDEFTEAPLGLYLDQAQIVKLNAAKIYDRVYIAKDMPLTNKTQMTDEERIKIAAWIHQGANINE